MSNWKLPPRQLALKPGEIHLWRLDLDTSLNESPTLIQTLAPEELARANQFVQLQERSRYIISHGVLRTLLAQYIGTAPREVVFRRGPHGKPELGEGALSFNMSHSKDLVLYAVTRTGPVGIDVECVLPGADVEITTAFCPRLAPRLAGLPFAARQRAFYQGWTRMEAYAKGCGAGLAPNLDELDRFLTRETLELVARQESSDITGRWCFYDLHPRKGYLGSLAASRDDYRLKHWKVKGGIGAN